MPRPLFDCISCHKYVPNFADSPARGGSCRAHPPAVIVVGAQKTQFGMEPIMRAVWPGVGKGDFCWEHPAAAVVGRPRWPSAPIAGAAEPIPGAITEMPAVEDEEPDALPGEQKPEAQN